MRLLLLFGTTEGHTRHLAEFAAAALRSKGHDVNLLEVGVGVAPDVADYEAIILAASLHAGRYQAALVDFAARHRHLLNAKPSAFISVSLSAAGENPDDWAGLEQCVDRFRSESGWTPGSVHHAAGAIRFSQYDFFKRLALQYIARRRGKKTVTTQDYDLTDYAALEAFLLQFVSDAGRPTDAAPAF